MRQKRPLQAGYLKKFFFTSCFPLVTEVGSCSYKQQICSSPATEKSQRAQIESGHSDFSDNRVREKKYVCVIY